MRKSGKTKILEYLKQRVGEWVSNQELRSIAGYKGNDVPRVIRGLRQEGWPIEVRGDGYNRLTSLEKGLGRGIRKPISEKLRYQILERDGHRCVSCGRGVQEGIRLQVDHITPVDWGGKTEPSNLETLCDECNRGKKNWLSKASKEVMQEVISHETVESRIEALFNGMPNQDVPSAMIRLVSRNALDWQRALRRIRQRTGKKILPNKARTAYRYYKD